MLQASSDSCRHAACRATKRLRYMSYETLLCGCSYWFHEVGAVEVVSHGRIIRVVRHWETGDSLKHIEIIWREKTLFSDVNHEYL